MKPSETAPGERERRDSEAVVQAVRDFQAGRRREECFRLLVETFHRPVEAFFARRLDSPDLCLDLTQETFLRVYKGLQGFRGEAPFGAWLFRIAWNVLRRQAAAAGPPAEKALDARTLEAAGDRHGEDDGAYASTLRGERQALLRRAIERLPPQRRRCIMLWAYQELSYDQIAAAMQLSLGTVKAHLAQARVQLEALVLEQEPAGSEHEPG